MAEREIQFTYDGDPRSSDISSVRWYVGDTDARRPLADDREIQFALDQMQGDVRQAAIIVLDALATRFAREADTTIGNISKALSKISEALHARARHLQDEIALRALPFFGGRSLSGKRTLAQDTDAIPPHFAFKQGDDPVAVQFDELHRLKYWTH